ncbi:19883_t:CDS:2, partial [Funneliformis geosporum]
MIQTIPKKASALELQSAPTGELVRDGIHISSNMNPVNSESFYVVFIMEDDYDEGELLAVTIQETKLGLVGEINRQSLQMLGDTSQTEPLQMTFEFQKFCPFLVKVEIQKLSIYWFRQIIATTPVFWEPICLFFPFYRWDFVNLKPQRVGLQANK